jgi:hypothetical protein
MISVAQTRLAHYIANLSIGPYTMLVQLMEERSPLIEEYKAMRQEFDQVYGEFLLLDAYRFSRRALEWCGVAYENALWAFMRQHHSSVARIRYGEIYIALERYCHEHNIEHDVDDQRLHEDVDQYLLLRIAQCLQKSPFAGEWKSNQTEAHLYYDFWWARQEATLGSTWRQDHPREDTPYLWKILRSRPAAATRMICLPGSLDDDLAQAKRALEQIRIWMLRFDDAFDVNEVGHILHIFRTRGMLPDDIHLFTCSEMMGKEYIVHAIQSTITLYQKTVERLRAADVPRVLLGPVDLWTYTVETNVEMWQQFLKRIENA